jgi:hypothetical protein
VEHSFAKKVKESLPKAIILYIAKFAGLFLTFRQKGRILLALSFDWLLILTALSTALSPEKQSNA